MRLQVGLTPYWNPWEWYFQRGYKRFYFVMVIGRVLVVWYRKGWDRT